MGFGTFPFGGGAFGSAPTDPVVPGTMIDPLDSYYKFVIGQMSRLPAPTPIAGYTNARDWPPTPLIDGALYLQFISCTPTPFKSWAQTEYEYLCQWMWLLIGSDITKKQQAANRGDRYRQTIKVMTNIKQANFPGFCPKQMYAADAEGNITGQPVSSSYPPNLVETIRWSHIKFVTQLDEKSGLVYGVGSLRVYAFDDVNAVLTL